MDFQKLLNISDDWLKYAIRLNLGHESKDNLVEIRKAALLDSRIKGYLSPLVLIYSRERVKVENTLDIFPRTEISLKTPSMYSRERKICKIYARHQSDAIVPC